MKSENSNKRWGSPSNSPFARVSQAVNLRIAYDDMDAIRAAADRLALPMSTFIRMAAMEKANQVNHTAAS